MTHRNIALTLSLLLSLPVASAGSNPGVVPPSAAAPSPTLETIRVGPNGRRFVLSPSGRAFTPWGFNYDHDRDNRLLETYWEQDWPTVECDFAEMKQLGANTVRIHLQLGSFMESPGRPNATSLHRLARLLKLAERTALYLDITGLGCYDKAQVPKWYNDLDETQRWEVQAGFWEAVARTCYASPAVFCYDLMNEPVVSQDTKTRDWTPGAFGDRYFVQRLVLDFAGRTEKQIARAWVEKMVAAIRKHDPRHLVTVGAIPWTLTWPNAKPLFYSPEVSAKLDFVSLHFYPKKDELDKTLAALRVYDIGKPIVIEEMFPLNCSTAELDRFIEASKPLACGWLSFYWGKTIPEYQQSKKDLAESLTLDWLQHVAKKRLP